MNKPFTLHPASRWLALSSAANAVLIIVVLVLIRWPAGTAVPVRPTGAAVRPTQTPQGPAGRVVDLAHPLVVGDPTPTTRAGVEALRPGEAEAAPHLVAASPNGLPAAGCWNHRAYRIVVGGQLAWSAREKNYTATVWFLWCPRSAGDTDGLFWAYGEVRVEGCGQVQLGGGEGALLDDASNEQAQAGLEPVVYQTCNGRVWDNLATFVGSRPYAVHLWASLPELGQVLQTSMDCYC